MKLIYIAGPYRHPKEHGVFDNIMNAREAGTAIAGRGDEWFPVCPHLNSMFMGGIREDDYWLDGDLELMRRCDALLLLDGWEESSGARAEREVAEAAGIPCFTESEFFSTAQ